MGLLHFPTPNKGHVPRSAKQIGSERRKARPNNNVIKTKLNETLNGASRSAVALGGVKRSMQLKATALALAGSSALCPISGTD